VLRKMIWDQHNPIDQAQFQKLRRLVVESYLIDHLLDDARIALLRYQQDYGADSPQERLLRARVMLRANEPHAAVNLLSSDESHEGKALYLMARLQSGTDRPDNVWRAALKQIRNSKLSKQDQAPYWVVAAYAAGVAAQYNKQAWFLERALATVAELDARDPIFVVRADDLWDAYIAAGNMLGNDAHLLIGEDEAWLNMAQALSDRDAPKARIIYALLTEHGSTSEVKENSHRQLVQLLRAEQGGDSIVNALYLDSRRYADSTIIPYPIRYVLANDALGRDQIPLASTLMGDIDDPPDGVDQQLWYLRWARVHILGGQVDRGVENLYNFLASVRQLERALADRVLQVVFDLQKIERYQNAANLFTVILPRISDVQQKREVLFWLADSYKAMGEYEQAARIYLRSAGLINAYAMDPWAQTARYHAAEALAQSGLIEDARMILEHLLSVTHAPERRSVLKHQLQQLHLE